MHASGKSTPSSDASLDYFRRVANEERAERAAIRKRERRRCLCTGWLCAGFVLVIILGLSIGLGIGISQRGSHGVALSFTGQNDTYLAMLESGIYESTFTTQGKDEFKYTGKTFNLSTSSDLSDRVLISVNRSKVRQEIAGFGAAMTDSSAFLLTQLKNQSFDDYNQVMNYLFNQRTGMTIVRVPIGSSDYSLPDLDYTLADTRGSNSDPLSMFSMQKADKYIIPILKDALARNPYLKLVLTPWSPPAWMKTNNDTGNGGRLLDGIQPVFVEYLVRSVQQFNQQLNTSVWGLNPQNEPFNTTPYPSMTMDVVTMGQVLAALRGRLAEVGLGALQLLGLEDNWSAMDTANQLVATNASALDGLAFHCYNGNYTLLEQLNAPGKSVHMTECTGITTDSVSADLFSLQYWMQNMFSLVSKYNIGSVMHWNVALNSKHGPRLPTALCKNCIGSLEVDGTSVTPEEQATMVSHHTAASADLSRFNGTAAFRVDAVITRDSKSNPNCIISTLAMGSKWSRDRNDSLQRLGIVLHNACSDTVGTAIQLENGKSITLDVTRGLTTVVFASLDAPNATASA